MTNDEAAARADNSLREFSAKMSAAGNPGSGRHELGMHKVDGWILDYDPHLGGAEIQTVIGVDGFVHTRRAERSLRVRKITGAEWVHGDPDAAQAFADRLAHMLEFNLNPHNELDDE